MSANKYQSLHGIVLADSHSVDSFARLRTSSPVTIFDSQNQYDLQPLLWENILNNGSVTHLPNESSAQLSTGGTTSGNYAYRQTRQYHRYQPGKSQLILFTMVMGALKANVRQRAGYFDDQNGIFFEQDGINLKAVRRTYTSGQIVDNLVNRSSWNIDRLDGSGISGFSLDTSKANIFFIDFEWLGTGRVRMGIFDDNGRPITCHEFRNTNELFTVYMTTANLPVRFEIENVGTAASATTMNQICVSVISEGGFESERGLFQTANTGTSSTSVTTRRAILSIRPKATFNSIVNRAQFESFDYDILGSAAALYEIVYNPTLTGTPTWTSAGASSAMEYSAHGDAANGAFTNGIVLKSGYLPAGGGTARSYLSNDIASKLPLTLDSAGLNPIALSLVLTQLSSTVNSSGAFTWKELK